MTPLGGSLFHSLEHKLPYKWLLQKTLFTIPMSLLQNYSHLWFDTSPRTENQHVAVVKSVCPEQGIEACPELVEGGEKDFFKTPQYKILYTSLVLKARAKPRPFPLQSLKQCSIM